MEYYYCILPSGNKSEFFELDCELIRRVVDAHITNLPGGGRIYRISEDDLCRLPLDEKGPYLGDDDSGHSLYKMGDAEHNRLEWGGSGWISLLQISQEAKNVIAETT
jgi:hypothetical protein